jgi:hypothetical protein
LAATSITLCVMRLERVGRIITSVSCGGESVFVGLKGVHLGTEMLGVVSITVPISISFVKDSISGVSWHGLEVSVSVATTPYFANIDVIT